MSHIIEASTLIFAIALSCTAAADQTPCPVALQQAQEELQDWANLARYNAEDQELAAAPAKGRVVFLGDSITDAWGRRENSVFFPGKPFVNHGIGGQTTPQMLIRFQQDVVSLKPAVVVILAGTNDIAGNTGPTTNEQIEDNLKSMIVIAKQNQIKVVLASLTRLLIPGDRVYIRWNGFWRSIAGSSKRRRTTGWFISTTFRPWQMGKAE